MFLCFAIYQLLCWLNYFLKWWNHHFLKCNPYFHIPLCSTVCQLHRLMLNNHRKTAAYFSTTLARCSYQLYTRAGSNFQLSKLTYTTIERQETKCWTRVMVWCWASKTVWTERERESLSSDWKTVTVSQLLFRECLKVFKTRFQCSVLPIKMFIFWLFLNFTIWHN